jgi:serine phosphatase RsbU (regulator of sigma subunit)
MAETGKPVRAARIGLPSELLEHLGGAPVAVILDALAEAVTIRDAENRILYANRPALSSMGFSSLEELQARPAKTIFDDYEVADEQGRALSMGDIPSVRLLAGESGEPLVIQTTNRETGVRRWSVLKASPLHGPDGRRVATVTIIEDITAEKLSHLRESFLARASQTLMSSLDHEETLRHVAWLAVPDLADWCAVDLLDEQDERQLVAVAHRDPGKAELASELARLRPLRPDPGGGVARVLETGTSELYPHVSVPPGPAGEDDRYRELLAELGLHSVIICPLGARGRILGTMTLINAESSRAFDQGDVTFCEELASRAAVAVDNARLATARRATAITLQESLLPARLPDIPGWQVAGLYRPGAIDEETEVGGDFYDLFDTERGWIVLLGDVTGKGMRAAAMTSLVRYGARFLGRHHPDPSAIFTRIDEALRERDELSLCTAICARLEPEHLVLAVAGHPSPLILRDDGRLRELGTTGPILGAWKGGSWPSSHVSVAPDETVILYTDGVTDVPGQWATGTGRRSRQRFGDDRLRRLLVAQAGQAPDQLLAALEKELAAFQEGGEVDDTAVLVLRPAAVTTLTGVGHPICAPVAERP